MVSAGYKECKKSTRNWLDGRTLGSEGHAEAWKLLGEQNEKGILVISLILSLKEYIGKKEYILYFID